MSLIILNLSDLKRDRTSLRSTMQILHYSVRADFMHLMPSPCQRMVDTMMLFIIFCTWLLLVQSRHILAKCLVKVPAPTYPPLPYQLCPNFFIPVSITFHTSLMCSFVLVLKLRCVLPTYDLPVLTLHAKS